MAGVAISADGVRIHYEVQGDGTPVLLFVHGWSCDQNYWREQTGAFPSKYTVVSIDLGGHGDSSQDRELWTMGAFGEDVAAVVAQLGLTNVILIGHSMGGPVIVEAARRMPTQVIGLIGVDTMKNLDITRTREQVEAFLAPFHADFVQATDSFVRNGMFVATSDPAFIESTIQDMASAPPLVGIGAADYLFSNGANMRAALQELHVPIVLINSDRSRTDMEAARRYGITLKEMSGVGHFVMIESPQTFNRLLEETVQQMVAESR